MEDEVYSSKEVYKRIDKEVTNELFKGFCEGCRWHREWDCSYSLYQKRLSYFLDAN